MSDLDPLSQIQVEDEIRRLSNELTKATSFNAQAAERAAQADVDYKLARARALIDLRGKGGTVPEKEATVLASVATQFENAKLAEAIYEASKEKGRNLRTQLDALRTIAANIRAAIDYTQGRGS